ncbi:Mce family protein [Gordonia araii NBRC 100433]|uniref:Mce family protein n=1 Tax=Gordonia araii NBRC 100433 TaxID=1073574 RepID=G7H1J4_9ACTN|nr:MCE family protein [Gordonia araii]NNG97772.1 MCE family protein [Gordonia araii NBRC 100433]GAB09719.1 Mce family protein [Gordonia araii NBRC 100433]
MAYGKKVWLSLVAALTAVLLVIVGYFGFQKATTDTVSAYFRSVTGLFPGDPVRVLGVNVGRVVSVEPQSDSVKVRMRLHKSVDVPADAKALIVAQSLVSGRFVQLAPVYTEGPKLSGGDDIPMERTAIPMEWDDLKKQLTRFTEAVGPDGTGSSAATRALGVADSNLQGNGTAINRSIVQMSKVLGTLSSGRDDLFSTIRSLQQLTESLSSSHEQLMQFNGRIATVAGILGDDTGALSDALSGLDSAMVDIKKFLDSNGQAMTKSMQQVATATNLLREKDKQLRGLLHSAPTQLSNFYNIYNPMTGSLGGIFGLGMGSNLITLLCGTMEANNRPGQSQAEVDKCVDVLAPVLKSMVINYPPFLINPVQGQVALPHQIKYQNADVKARAQQGIRDLDAQTRRANNLPNPLGSMLVPYGAER